MTLDNFLFGVYPYIAGVVFILGSWIRFDREQYTWKADSSQLLGNKGMVWPAIYSMWVLLVFSLVTRQVCCYHTAGGN